MRVTFEDGERVTEHWDGAIAGSSYCLRSTSASALSAEVDPDRVLLLDVNYTNNSKTLRAATDRGRDEVVAEVDGLAAGLSAVVGGARMTHRSAAWRDGVRRVNRAPATSSPASGC